MQRADVPEYSPARSRIRRVAVISLHTSPLDQPGAGDAGGMNVYVTQAARRLAERGVEVDVFTRASRSDLPAKCTVTPGFTVRHIPAGPFGPLDRAMLAGQLCPFTFGMLRAGTEHAPGHYDVVHSHYWLAGRVGRLVARQWRAPLVHSMHTLAKVKSAAFAEAAVAESPQRVQGEIQLAASSDRLIANTADEARQLVTLYGANPGRVSTVYPGVDLGVFHPGSAAAARARLGLPAHSPVLLFVGRLQKLKGPDVLLRAAAELVRSGGQDVDGMLVAVVGGSSGTGDYRSELAALAGRLGIGDRLRFVAPCPQNELADWYRAATLTVVPSRSESFGLVAVESQACGTPVVAAAVGGLTTVVDHEASGILVDGHDPATYARTLCALLGQPGRLAELGTGAVAHARRFGWSATVDGLLDVYAAARSRVAGDGHEEEERASTTM